MEPTFRDQLLHFTERLRAEEMILWAQAVRVAMADNDEYELHTGRWKAFADGAEVDRDVADSRGRPVTDSLEEFTKFFRYDRSTLLKHGVINKNEYIQ